MYGPKPRIQSTIISLQKIQRFVQNYSLVPKSSLVSKVPTAELGKHTHRHTHLHACHTHMKISDIQTKHSVWVNTRSIQTHNKFWKIKSLGLTYLVIYDDL